MTHHALPPGADDVTDAAAQLRDLGDWIVSMSGVLDRMHPRQRRELLRAAAGLRRDLAVIRLDVPGVTR